MALITETGTGASNSESYASVANADNYHNLRGNATWATLSTAVKEESLRKANDYIEQVYSQAWQGLALSSTQALSFPRSSVVVGGYTLSSTAIPPILINASIELALKAYAGELAEDQTQALLREKIDVIEMDYNPNSPQRKRYIAIENMLRPLLDSHSVATAKLLRV